MGIVQNESPKRGSFLLFTGQIVFLTLLRNVVYNDTKVIIRLRKEGERK